MKTTLQIADEICTNHFDWESLDEYEMSELIKTIEPNATDAQIAEICEHLCTKDS